jgi:hypothetical protein
MRKAFMALGLLAGMMFVSTPASGADEDDTPKKGRFKGKFKGKLVGNLDKLFEKADANGDGKISKEEFRKFFSKLGQGKLAGKGGQLADRIFDKLDSNEDGFLSKEEFKKLAGLRAKFKEKFGGKLRE